MKRLLLIVGMTAALSACDMSRHGPRTIIEVDGYRIGVSHDARPGVNDWIAAHLPGQGTAGHGGVYARNIRAIEIVAGCPIMKGSVYNNVHGYSKAAITCYSG